MHRSLCPVPRAHGCRWLPGLLLLGMVFISGCATTQKSTRQVSKLEGAADNPRILLVRPDIKFYLLTAGGLPEPHAEWTAAARANFLDSVTAFGQERGVEVVRMDEGVPMSDEELAYERLHAAVGVTVLMHYLFGNRLPTKGDTFDWSLGPGVSVFRERYDADYALFVSYRHQQPSAGRAVLAAILAVTRIPIPVGGQSGFASLVDLRTGDLVWFNLVGSGPAADTGDLRDPEGADEVIRILFKDLPER